MSRLQEIKDQVAIEKYRQKWDDLIYDTYPDDTYVNYVSRYEMDVLMEEVARQYATEMVTHNLEKAVGFVERGGVDHLKINFKTEIL